MKRRNACRVCVCADGVCSDMRFLPTSNGAPFVVSATRRRYQRRHVIGPHHAHVCIPRRAVRVRVAQNHVIVLEDSDTDDEVKAAPSATTPPKIECAASTQLYTARAAYVFVART